MKKIHLKYSLCCNKPALCGSQSGSYEFVETYIKHPNLDEFPYQYPYKECKWCQDCITHPDLVIEILNKSNV